MQATVTAATPQPPPVHPAPGTGAPGPWAPGGAAPDAPRDRKALRWTVLAIAITGSAVATGFFPPFAILFAFIFLVPFEKLFPRHPYKLRRPGLAIDLQYGLTLPIQKLLVTIALFVVGFLSFAWAPAFLLHPIVSKQPAWLIAIETIILFDLIGYWVHRAEHAVPALWRMHSIHHSSERLDWIAGIRSHPLDGFIAGAPYAFVLGMGLGSISGLAYIGVIQVVASLWAHVNVRWNLRPLHWFVLTPEMHHWHHANEPDAFDRNFTNLLPIWDLLFGTYYMPKGKRPANYGIDEPVPPTMWRQWIEPLRWRKTETRSFAPMTTTMSSVPTPVGPSGYTPVVSGQPIVQHYGYGAPVPGPPQESWASGGPDPASAASVPHAPSVASVPAAPHVPSSWGQAPYPVGAIAPIPPARSTAAAAPTNPPAVGPPPDDPYGPPRGTAF